MCMSYTQTHPRASTFIADNCVKNIYKIRCTCLFLSFAWCIYRLRPLHHLTKSRLCVVLLEAPEMWRPTSHFSHFVWSLVLSSHEQKNASVHPLVWIGWPVLSIGHLYLKYFRWKSRRSFSKRRFIAIVRWNESTAFDFAMNAQKTITLCISATMQLFDYNLRKGNNLLQLKQKVSALKRGPL
jgi:membrane-anchored protein YejM (alkaline phosphatase superfamily)